MAGAGAGRSWREGAVSPTLCPAGCFGQGSALLPGLLQALLGHGTCLLCWVYWGLGALDPSAELEGASPAFQGHFGLNPITLLPSRVGCG